VPREAASILSPGGGRGKALIMARAAPKIHMIQWPIGWKEKVRFPAVLPPAFQPLGE